MLFLGNDVFDAIKYSFLGKNENMLVKKAFLLLKRELKKGQIFFLIVLLRQIS